MSLSIMLLLTVKHMSGRLSVTETTANVPVTQRNNYTKYLFRNVWNEAREFTPLVCLYMIMTGLCVCVCVRCRIQACSPGLLRLSAI